MMMMKPIHKFNNGNGATLCYNCSVIIIVRLTDDLFCSKECEAKYRAAMYMSLKANTDIEEYYKQMENEVHQSISDLNKK